jgi:hypothetical protein
MTQRVELSRALQNAHVTFMEEEYLPEQSTRNFFVLSFDLNISPHPQRLVEETVKYT